MAPIERNGQEINEIALSGNSIGEVKVNGQRVFISEFKVEAVSAGLDSDPGGFSKLIVDGNDIGDKGRGINALELDPSGDKVRTDNFDVYSPAESESQRLTDFINTATNGNILMFAEDDHAGRITSNAVSALQGLGSDKIDDVANDARSSYVFICIKGGGTFGEVFAPSGQGPVSTENVFSKS